MDPVYLLVGGGVALISAVIGWGVGMRRSAGRRTSVQLDLGKSITLKPVLSEAEARFYNLLRMAVEDRYLIFAHVPLWCLVDVPMPEAGSRVPLLSQLALKRATFVLVHPGTRQAEKVVDWKDDNEGDASENRPDSLLETVLKPAGVQLVTINAGGSYTVADLATLFDTADPDS
jgi:uncharacterized protein DUF2726